MKIGRQFNTFTYKEYFSVIDNHKKYTDFNTLGLYRSILENDKLSLEQKIAVRNYAHRTFAKTFDFYQLKDPDLYMKLSTLGQVLEWDQEFILWRQVVRNQQKILADKKIKHRNFGIYSKHDCGYEHCPMNGMMVRQGSPLYLALNKMHFDSDKPRQSAKTKALRYRKARKHAHRIITRDQDLD